jgi:glycerol-3-phosphate dehydrogenase (NAD(P)+)
MRVTILGAGSWGRALATLVAEAGNQPHVGYRGKPGALGFPGSPAWAALVAEADLTLLAVPPAAVREVVQKARPGPAARVVVATRGLEPGTGAWLTDVVAAESACLRVGALTGPALAAEVVARRPGALVAASAFEEVGALTQAALHSPICRVYTSTDLRGVELSGAMVNVLAVAMGVAAGLDLGLGVRGVIVTRGIAEAVRLARALGADPQTPAGLAGVGDLVGAATHPESPGFAAGLRIARGHGGAPAQVQEAEALLTRAARAGVELPLTEAVAAIAAQKLAPRLAIDMLMRRQATREGSR